MQHKHSMSVCHQDAELFFTALEHMGSAFVRNNVVGPIQVVPYGEGKKVGIRCP